MHNKHTVKHLFLPICYVSNDSCNYPHQIQVQKMAMKTFETSGKCLHMYFILSTKGH